MLCEECVRVQKSKRTQETQHTSRAHKTTTSQAHSLQKLQQILDMLTKQYIICILYLFLMNSLLESNQMIRCSSLKFFKCIYIYYYYIIYYTNIRRRQKVYYMYIKRNQTLLCPVFSCTFTSHTIHFLDSCPKTTSFLLLV